MWRVQRTPWPRDTSDLHLRSFHRMVTLPPGALPSIAYCLDAESHVRGVALFEKLEGVEPLEDRAFLAHCLDDLCGHLRGLLRRNDRMAMAASIEVRVPFLENRLIDTANSAAAPGARLCACAQGRCLTAQSKTRTTSHG
jgi:hypothetical protein